MMNCEADISLDLKARCEKNKIWIKYGNTE